jgi:hypothetical protein
MKYKNLVFIFIGLILITACATTNHNYFQTAKPSGKDEGEGSLSFSAASAVDYKITDELGSPPVIDIKKEKKWAPLFAIQFNGGATEHTDGGFAVGLSSVSFNLRLFSKLSLFDKNSRFGIGLLPAFNLSFTPDSLWIFELPRATNVNFYLSLPISYDLSDRITFVVRPTYGREYTKISVIDDDYPEDKYSKSIYFNGRGISAGFKILIKKPDKYIFPEVSFITYDRGVHYIPFIGIAFIQGKIIKEEKKY